MAKKSVEETLSTIKTLNIEIDQIERFIRALQTPALNNPILLVSLNNTQFVVHSTVGDEISQLMLKHYGERHKELIDKGALLIGGAKHRRRKQATA
jgi:hypothetical protein